MQKDLMLKCHVIMPSNFKKNVCCEITPPPPSRVCAAEEGGFSPTPPHPLLSRQ